MPPIIPSDDTFGLSVITAGNNVWIDTDLLTKWRLRDGKNVVEEFDSAKAAYTAAEEYIKAKIALKGT